jgi:hypothetical protein
MFNLLQKWHSQITEMDYIVEANNVVILDHAVEDDGNPESGVFGSVHDMFAKWNEEEFNEDGGANKDGKKETKRRSRTHSTPTPLRKKAAFRPTLSGFSENHKNLRPPASCLPVFQQSG